MFYYIIYMLWATQPNLVMSIRIIPQIITIPPTTHQHSIENCYHLSLSGSWMSDEQIPSGIIHLSVMNKILLFYIRL